MRRKVLFVFFLTGFIFNAFAENGNGLSFGPGFMFGGWTDMGGAAFEFGFPIHNGNNWDIRDNILVSGFEITDKGCIKDTVLTISDKVTIGRTGSSGFAREYGYLEGGVGFFTNDDKDLFEMPLTFFVSFGGGIELFALEKSSWYFEAGAAVHYLPEDLFWTERFSTGWRQYF